MATLFLNKKKLKHNFQFLKKFFENRDTHWAVVTKLLCGNEVFLNELISLGVEQICESRVQNLISLKRVAPDINALFIRPPSLEEVKDIVTYADISFNTEIDIIKALNEEAEKQQKSHKIIIMIDLGDLREGIMGDDLLNFYEKIQHLNNIEVVGIGSNLNCMCGVKPTQDKFIQLCLYKQLLETKFGINLPLISAGTSICIPLFFKEQVPKGINHFRVGETLYFGNDKIEHTQIQGMVNNIFELEAEIIEIIEKPKVPIGELSVSPRGDYHQIEDDDYGKSSYRAIFDIGYLDSHPSKLTPQNPNYEVLNASSDMLIIDMGTNQEELKAGDIVRFNVNYIGALSLLHSDYIEKKLVN